MASDSCSACCLASIEAFSVAGSWMSRSRTFSTVKAALIELGRDLVINLLGHHLAFAGVEGVGGVRSGSFTNGGAEGGLDHHVLIVGADLLENIGGVVGIEVVNERSIQTHHQAFAGRHAGRFFNVWVWIDISLLVFSGLMR